MDYINATAEEKQAWIEGYVDRRMAEGYDQRLPRYRSGGRGRSGKSTISPRASLKRKARKAWLLRKNRQRKDKENGKESPLSKDKE